MLSALGDDATHGPASLGLVEAGLRRRGLDVDRVDVAVASIARCRSCGAA